MSTAQSTRFDLDALRRAIHDGDVAAMVALYADDAELMMVDQEHPPSAPGTVRGRDEIEALFTDVFARDMTHEVVDVIADGEIAAYQIACRYGDGTRVLVSGMMAIRDGRIARETAVQAWDT